MPLLLSLIATLSDIMGGVLFMRPIFSKIDNRYILGIASGIVISASFFELLPEANIETNSQYVALGFFLFYLVEKIVMLHSCGEKECDTHSVGWVAAFGMATDNIIDGVGIAVGYFTAPKIGFVITLAVILHEIPQGITTAMLMKKANFKPKYIFLTLFMAGIMYPVGAYLSRFIPHEFYKITIAFVAGTFLYIGTSDLLTEAHRTFNIKVVLSVLAGALIPLLLETLV